MRTENVQGISERDHDEEQYIYKLVIGPKNKEWWVDYLPEPFPLQINPTDIADEPTPREELTFDTARSEMLAPQDINYFESDSDSENILLIFRDGLDQPIPGLQITTEGVEAIGERTDDNGTLQIAPTKKSGKVSIKANGINNNQQRVCEIDLSKCRKEIKIQSPKVVISAKSTPTYAKNPHGPGVYSCDSEEQSTSPWYQWNGSLKKSGSWLKSILHTETHPTDRAGTDKQPHRIVETMTSAGHPATVIVGPEVDEKNNLRLGVNNIYRAIILKAAKRLNIVPHAICCLLECEASQRIETTPAIDKNGNALLHKSGKNKEKPIIRRIPYEWDAKSFNADSNAAGLTQFLPLTWLYCILQPGFYISDKSIEQKRQWLAQYSGKRYFVNENGKYLKKISKITNDKNIDECLRMRFDPEWSIMAAADYAQYNYNCLSSKINLGTLSDGEKIKIMYLMHHEGLMGGLDFITNNLNIKKNTWRANVPNPDKWLKKAKYNKNEAYRLFLADYIDQKICFDRFAFDKTKIEPIKPLLTIINGIKNA